MSGSVFKKHELTQRLVCPKEIDLTFVFYLDLLEYWIKFSEYMYFYISKNIISYTFLHVFKIIKNLQCILMTVLESSFL